MKTLKNYEVRKISLSQMKPSEYNPRKKLQKGDPAYDKLEKAMDEFGYLQFIVWNEATGNIVGGERRYDILKSKGETEAEVIVINEPDLSREKVINLGLNKITGEWDSDKLADVLEDLLTADIDPTLTGFDMPDIDRLTVPEDIFAGMEDIDLSAEYKEPEKKQLRCPNCSHVDNADRFKKL